MNAQQIKKKFTKKDIELTLWAKTTSGEILRLIQVGRKWITLMYGNGDTKRVENVQAVAPFASDLPS